MLNARRVSRANVASHPEEERRMKPSISLEEFATLLKPTGLKLTPEQVSRIYEGYGYLEALIARVNAPLPRDAEPALTFAAEERR